MAAHVFRLLDNRRTQVHNHSVPITRAEAREPQDNPLLEVDDVFAEVFSLIRRGEAVTRPALSHITGLRRAVITQRVEQAITAGLVEDFTIAESTGGRAARQLRFRSESGTILAAMTGTEHVSVGATDLAGNILGIVQRPWDVKAGPQAALDGLAAALDRVLAENKVSTPVWGVGLGMPGAVDFATGRPDVSSMMPGWDGFDIRAFFEDKYCAPVWVDNDLNILALEEWHRGAQLDPDAEGNVILIKVSNGIGAGILSRGFVHRGRNGGAGDIGHTPSNTEGSPRCRCGQSGCMEAMAGGWALVRDATKAAHDGQSTFLSERLNTAGFLTPADITDGARRSDPVSLEMVNRSATLVGKTLASLVSFFNPATVYVSGIIPAAGDMFLVGVRRAVYQHALPLATRDLQIVQTTLTTEDGVVGAANLAIEQLFHPDLLPIWLPHTTPAGLKTKLYSPGDINESHGAAPDANPARTRTLPSLAGRTARR